MMMCTQHMDATQHDIQRDTKRRGEPHVSPTRKSADEKKRKKRKKGKQDEKELE